MLLPALQQAKDKGAQATCVGQLRQMGMAAYLYVDDYDGWLAPCRWEPDPAANRYIYQKLYGYARESFCKTQYQNAQQPSNPACAAMRNEEGIPVGVGVVNYAGHNWGGYGQNQNTGYYSTVMHNRMSLLKEFTLPAETFWMCDAYYYHLSRGGWDQANTFVRFRHSGGLNLLYFDGHTGWKRGGPSAIVRFEK
jgi:prepilin-type processing-associated H-X9-DG protein